MEREPRQIRIYSIELVAVGHDYLKLDIQCSKGTYIRTLAEDIGRKLQCGAHVSALRRTGTGPFKEEQAVTLDELEAFADDRDWQALDARLLDIDAALVDLPAVEITHSISEYLCDGQAVVVPHAPTNGMLRIYTDSRAFLGVGEVLDDGRVAPRRLILQ